MEHDPRSSFSFLNRDKLGMYLDWLDLWQKGSKKYVVCRDWDSYFMKEIEMYERTAEIKHIIRANSDIKNFFVW